MNRLSILIISLILSACVADADVRPSPYLNSEALLQQGITAFQNDDFSEAKQNFSHALELYKSFDNNKGIALAQSNLVETALAISDFADATFVLAQLKQQTASHHLETELRRKIILLEVKLQFEQQHYPEALIALKPLLVEEDTQKNDDAQLNLWAMQAKLEVLISPLTQSSGLAKLETAVAQLEPPSPHYQALLKRTLAIIALKRNDYKTAASLLNEALDYYKLQANRRAIASCFEELADIEIAQRHTQAAEIYLNKALVIRQWLKDDSKSGKIRAYLKAIKQHE